MDKIIHLSLTRKNVPTRMDVVQYATRPKIVFVIDDYTPTGQAALYIKKPDGTKIYNSCVISGNTVTYTPTTQSFAALGKNECQLQIVEPNGTAVSFLIYADVTENIIDSSAVESQDEFTELETALQTVASYDGRITQVTNDLAAFKTEEKPLVLGYGGGTGGGIVQPSALTVTTGEWVLGEAITIPSRGFWFLHFAVTYQANATGVRAVRFSATPDTSTALGNLFFETEMAAPGNNLTMLNVWLSRNVTSTYTLYPQYFQSSGIDLTATPKLELIRIGDTLRTS